MYDIKRLEKASSIEEALELYKKYPESHYLAGGTDVMIHLKNRRWKAASLISIGEIPELKEIKVLENGSLRIGSAVDFHAICECEDILSRVPILAEGCGQVGSPQIRHIATIGGNVCNGAVSADSVPALMVLNAELELVSSEGTRVVDIKDFHTGPGRTVCRPGELLTAFIIHKESYEGFGGCYLKFGTRNAMEIATLSCAANVKLDSENKVKDIRIAYGVAAPTPVRCTALESKLKGAVLADEQLKLIEEHAIDELKPRNSWRASLEFREQLIKTLGVRAVQEAVTRAASGMEA